MLRYKRHQFHPKEKEIEVFLTGCSIRCLGCHNQELWDELGTEKNAKEILNDLLIYKPVAKRVLIMGGEPLDQYQFDSTTNNNELEELCFNLIKHGFEVILYTGYSFDEVLEKAPNILNCISAIKCGRFIKEELSPDGEFASSNQKLYISGKDYNLPQ